MSIGHGPPEHRADALKHPPPRRLSRLSFQTGPTTASTSCAVMSDTGLLISATA